MTPPPRGRLDAGSLARLDPAVRPRVDPAGLDVGILHIGLGAFHRAHQAVHTEDAMAAGGCTDWGICAVSPRSTATVERIAAQDGLYSLWERGARCDRLRVVGSLREARSARLEWESVLERFRSPTTRIVTLTVTEKGYRHDPRTGRLRHDDAETAADVGNHSLHPERPPVTAPGQLVRGLDARRAAGSGPLTVLCCDNLSSNGPTLARLVGELCGRLAAPASSRLLAWLEENVSFPATMVDRIVPAVTDADLEAVASRLGVSDLGAVVAEPFSQWVVEDRFTAGRPPWELAGVTLTDDVAPWELVKLRLLNGAHSTLAYTGALAGAGTIAEAAADPLLAELARRLMDEAATTLEAPAGLDVASYRDTVVERFANPALRHLTTQVAMDGSQKLPQRLLGTMGDLIASGREPRLCCLALAAWMCYVSRGRSDAGAPLPLEDPMAGAISEAAQRAGSAATLVPALLAFRSVFDPELAASPTVRELTTGYLEQMAADGTRAAVEAALR